MPSLDFRCGYRATLGGPGVPRFLHPTKTGAYSCQVEGGGRREREHSYLLKRLCPEPVFSLGSAIRLLWASVCLSVKWGVDRDREAAKKVFKVVFVGSPNSHEGRWLALLLPARVITDKPILVCP